MRRSLRRLGVVGGAAWLLSVIPLFAQADPKQIPASTPAPFSVEVIGEGPPILLIPGLSSGGNVWEGTVEHFKATHQCHVFTLAGFAGQPPIGPVGEPFLAQIRDALCRYIREQKLNKPILVGHSLGAFMAFWVGATIPDEIGAVVAVDGVPFFPALRDPSATPQTAQSTAFLISAPVKLQTPEQFRRGNRAMLRSMISDPKELERIAAVSDRSTPGAVGAALYELMTTDLRPLVPAITAPVLLVGATAGTKDPDQKKREEANYRAQVETIPRHQVVFATNARHFIQLDEPAFLFGQIESFFLQMRINPEK